jgi:tetratricopeptide (TPR) repeat protein
MKNIFGAFAVALFLTLGAFAQSPNDVVAQRTLLRVFIDTGRYTEAEAAAKRFLQKTPEAGPVRHELAEALASTGRYTEAITEFERAAADSEKSDKLESDLRRAEVLDLIGQEDRAKTIYESFVKYYTDNDPETAEELTLIARALVHLERFQDANDMYRSAIEADSNYFEAQLGAAELFTAKYAYGDAALFLEDAFKINPNSARAYLNLARNKRF